MNASSAKGTALAILLSIFATSLAGAVLFVPTLDALSLLLQVAAFSAVSGVVLGLLMFGGFHRLILSRARAITAGIAISLLAISLVLIFLRLSF